MYAAEILLHRPDWFLGNTVLGGRTTLLGISKRRDKNLRRLLVLCARILIMRLDHQSGRLADWVRAQLQRKHSNVVTCALANKLARIAWAITTQNSVFEK